MKSFVACLAIGLTVLLATPGTPAAPAPVAPAPQWTMDLAKMKAPDGPITGEILGAAFKVESVQLEPSGALLLSSGNNSAFIFLPIKNGRGFEGKSYELNPDDKEGRLDVHLHIFTTDPPSGVVYSKGYALRVEFGKAEDGKVPGKVFLCLPDDRKSFIAGSFTLKLE